MKNHIVQRIDDFRKLMTQYGIDYYIIPTSDPHMSEYINPYYEARRYISGFTGDAGTLVIGPNSAYLWTDGRFYVQAAQELLGTGIELMKAGMDGVPTIIQFLEKTMEKSMSLGMFSLTLQTEFALKLKALCKKKKCKFETKYDLVNDIWKDRPEIVYQDIMFKGNEIYGESVESKLTKVREYLHRNMLDGYFFSKLDEVMYLFNIRGNDIPYNPVAVSYAFVDQDSAVLFVDESVINNQLIEYSISNGFEIKAYGKICKYLKKHISSDTCIGLDYGATNYHVYKSICKVAKAINVNSVVEKLKAIKNEHEIKCIREYFRLDSAALTNAICEIYSRINSGIEMDENDVSNIIYNHRSKISGFICESFPTIAAYGANGAIIHYVPDADNCAKLKKSGLMVIDSGAQYECATTDVTRTIALGELSKKEKAAFTDVTMGMLYLMNAIFASGCTGRNLDILARERLWKKGMNFNHGTGHGVGCCLNVHEGPHSIRYRFSANEENTELKPGMLITDEPGYYEPHEFGIRSENTLLVVKKNETEYGEFYGFDSLTLVPLDIECFDLELLDGKDIEMINKYQKMVYESIKDQLDVTTLEWLKNRLYL